MILASLLLAAVVPLTEVLDGLHDYEEGVELEATVSDVFADLGERRRLFRQPSA